MLIHSSSPGAEKKQGCVAERLQEEGLLQAKASPEPVAWCGAVRWELCTEQCFCALLQILLPHRASAVTPSRLQAEMQQPTGKRKGGNK